MCFVKAYIKRGADKEVLLEDVASIKYDGEELVLETLFGEKRSIRAIIKEIDFANSIIFLEEKSSQETQR